MSDGGDAGKAAQGRGQPVGADGDGTNPLLPPDDEPGATPGPGAGAFAGDGEELPTMPPSPLKRSTALGMGGFRPSACPPSG